MEFERAPRRTFRVGAEHDGHLVGPAPKRTNQFGSDGPERLDGVMRATCTLHLEFYMYSEYSSPRDKLYGCIACAQGARPRALEV